MLPDVETASQYHLEVVFGRVGDKSPMQYCWMRLIFSNGYFGIRLDLVSIEMWRFSPTGTSYLAVIAFTPAAQTALVTQK